MDAATFLSRVAHRARLAERYGHEVRYRLLPLGRRRTLIMLSERRDALSPIDPEETDGK